MASLWNTLLSCLAPGYHWRKVCPDTLEAIADDFIAKHLPDCSVCQALDFNRIDDGDPWFAWRRRVAAIYGVATCYQHPRGDVARPGWNRSLWQHHPNTSPEQLVDRIFEQIIQQLRTANERSTRSP